MLTEGCSELQCNLSYFICMCFQGNRGFPFCYAKFTLFCLVYIVTPITGLVTFFFFFLINLFIYSFLAVLGLRFCVRAFSSCGKWGPLFIAMRGPLTVAASLVAEHRLQMRRLSSCGSRAQLLRGMWDLPRPGLEPVSPALAGGFSTTAPPGKPWPGHFLSCQYAFTKVKERFS